MVERESRINWPHRFLIWDHGPSLACPPLPGDIDPFYRQQAATHRLTPLPLAHQLPEMPADGTLLVFFLIRHSHNPEEPCYPAIDLADSDVEELEVFLSSCPALVCPCSESAIFK